MQVSSITKMAEIRVQLLFVHSLSLIVLLSCYHHHVNATESPPYTVVLSSPDLEIRLYRDSSWISAAVAGGTSFNKSTHDGFHRLYQYVHGGNEYNTRFKITTPTVTTVTAARSDGSSDYLVSMYITSSISRPPMASPQLNLCISNWKNHCVAVRRFSGFAVDDNIYKERSLLSSSLAKSFIFNGKNVSISEDKSSYSVAQYNSSTHLSGRVNEAWIDVIPCPVLH